MQKKWPETQVVSTMLLSGLKIKTDVTKLEVRTLGISFISNVDTHLYLRCENQHHTLASQRIMVKATQKSDLPRLPFLA